MTQPTQIYFGPAGPRFANDPSLKVYLRALLYATAKRGRVIESLFVRVTRERLSQSFNIWTYEDERAGGLYVGEDGVSAGHNFLLPFDGTRFEMVPGAYVVEVFASLAGESRTRLLRSIHLQLTPEHSAALNQSDHGLFFEWNPEAGGYETHIRAVAQATLGLT